MLGCWVNGWRPDDGCNEQCCCGDQGYCVQPVIAELMSVLGQAAVGTRTAFAENAGRSDSPAGSKQYGAPAVP